MFAMPKYRQPVSVSLPGYEGMLTQFAVGLDVSSLGLFHFLAMSRVVRMTPQGMPKRIHITPENDQSAAKTLAIHAIRSVLRLVRWAGWGTNGGVFDSLTMCPFAYHKSDYKRVW